MHRLKSKFTILKLIWFLFNDPADISPSWLWNLVFIMWARSAVYVCVVCALHRGAWTKGVLAKDWNTACEVYEHLPRGDAFSNIHWDAFIG